MLRFKFVVSIVFSIFLLSCSENFDASKTAEKLANLTPEQRNTELAKLKPEQREAVLYRMARTKTDVKF